MNRTERSLRPRASEKAQAATENFTTSPIAMTSRWYSKPSPFCVPVQFIKKPNR